MEVQAVQSLIKILIRLDLLSQEPSERIFETSKDGALLTLAKKGILSEAEALQALSDHFQVPFVDLESVEDRLQTKNFAGEIDINHCWDHRILPMWPEGNNSIALAIVNPCDIESVEAISFSLGKTPKLHLAREGQIKNYLKELLPASRVQFDEDFDVEDSDYVEIIKTAKNTKAITEQEMQSKPVVKICNKIIADAFRQGASDIHLEPVEGALELRFRIDGMMHNVFEIPVDLQAYVVSRLKLLAGMDIAERRKPQDGRFQVKIDTEPVDVRVSSIPTAHGENLVLRLLHQDGAALEFSKLGFNADLEERIKHYLGNRGKMLLVTGPTGSGKTTTLYTCLSDVHDGTLTIQTAEDPVEYRIKGVQQIQINPAAGVTFASTLRSMLRQDPDVIMVGEIRDRETAQIALQAAQTGHLVLSTLHTNDAPGAITRLLDLEIAPYMIATSIAGVLAQRLARRVCESCAQPISEDQRWLYEADIERWDLDPSALRVGFGCKKCHDTGYRGRVGIYSLLDVTPDLAEAISNNASGREIERVARQDGYQSLTESALRLAREGITTLEEVRPYLGTAKSSSPSITVHPSTPEKSSEPVEKVVKEPKKSRSSGIEKARILLIDDDDDIRSVLSMMLEREMYEVIEAYNGEDGLQKVYENLPDLVVADLMMPKMDGREFLLKMKKSDKTESIPVVMLTAANTEDNEVDLIDLGANDFVSKSASSKVLLSRIRRAMATAEEG